MLHNHKNHEHCCSHLGTTKYCHACRVSYCTKCGAEWPIYQYYTPQYTPFSQPYYGGGVNGSGGSHYKTMCSHGS